MKDNILVAAWEVVGALVLFFLYALTLVLALPLVGLTLWMERKK